MKAGQFTTEFWLTLFAMAAATAALLAGSIDASIWVVVMSGGAGVYSVARGVAKINPPKE